MKRIDTLVTDIYGLFSGHECSDALLDEFATTLKEQIKTSLKQYKQERKGYLRMSNIGKPCGRHLWYETHNTQSEPLPPATKFKFLYGHILESVLIYLAKEAGHSVRDEQKRVEYDGIKGSIDCVIDDVLVDVKSASTFSFQKFKDETLPGNDPFGYLAQISGYKAATGEKDAAFLAVDKTLGHICLYRPERLPDASSCISGARVATEGEVPPERIEGASVAEGKSGNRKLSIGCSYCGYKQECWKDVNKGKGIRTFLYSRGPVFLVEVEKEPNVLEAT